MRTINMVKKSSKRYPAVIMAVSLAMLTGCSGAGNEVQGRADDLDLEWTENGPERENTAWGNGGQYAESGIQADAETAAGTGIQADAEIPAGTDIQADAEASTEIGPQPEPDQSTESVIIPRLPLTGGSLSDFVLEGWTLIDSVELDFNGDGRTDYVGVQETEQEENMGIWEYPRILFAVASDGAGQYRLDFQNENLIRTRNEGGVYGDPYMPLTAEGKAFTTHSYGGSAWRWAEDCTYEYIEGMWYLTLSEEKYEYYGYITEYRLNDWKRGIGIRERRSSEFSDMDAYWNAEEEPECDLAYEIPLDEMPALYQAGMRWQLATKRVTDWNVESLLFAEGINLSENLVKYPDAKMLPDYNDEDCALYIFREEESGKKYIAMYRWQDNSLSVLAEVDSGADSATLYKNSIYYFTNIVESVIYRSERNGKEYVTEDRETVGVRLNRMNLDGTGQEIIFEYRYPGTEEGTLEDSLPYLSAIYEISGDEIVLEVYIGEEPHPFYRMNLDGTNLQRIGQIPKK